MMAIFIVMGSQADLPRWPDETGGGIILQGHGNHDVIWAIQFEQLSILNSSPCMVSNCYPLNGKW